jgi:uncharacterized protein YbaR (Trm112 family)
MPSHGALLCGPQWEGTAAAKAKPGLVTRAVRGRWRKEGLMAISKELLDILACPKCKGEIYLNQTGDGLICDQCKLLYEIRDDIPIMLIDEAKPIG